MQDEEADAAAQKGARSACRAALSAPEPKAITFFPVVPEFLLQATGEFAAAYTLRRVPRLLRFTLFNAAVLPYTLQGVLDIGD